MLEKNIEKIDQLYEAFKENANKTSQGVKMAGRRARTGSVELTKALKEFRMISLGRK